MQLFPRDGRHSVTNAWGDGGYDEGMSKRFPSGLNGSWLRPERFIKEVIGSHTRVNNKLDLFANNYTIIQ
jgi:hypothetical protein